MARNDDGIIVGNSLRCLIWSACSGFFKGTAWDSETPLSDGGIHGDDEPQTYPYGVNADAKVVGWVRYVPEVELPLVAECYDTAVYWDEASAEPVDLGPFMPDWEENEDIESRAFALNSAARPQVVGTNFTDKLGIIWQNLGDPSEWEAFNLNGCIGGWDEAWAVIEAHDINDSGWIVAYARRTVAGDPPTIEEWSVLLSPMPDCPADIDRNGTVNSADLTAVINGWGACPLTGVMCIADVNNDGTVGTLDLLAVTNAWGDCPGSFAPGGEPPSWLQDIIDILNDPELTEEQQVELIAAILSEIQ